MTADVRYSTRLRCDRHGCPNLWPDDQPSGWTYHSLRGDLCPDHAQTDGDQ